ncbi:MAG: NUDIX domain-containing protein [Spirochaetaceae bacterium]|jgi:8-oxo-dGTP pyrophosphatase MutT (NUDIX family)|nr:NUDIX domain-containing protein [Spirochaetaceae bacterium]
MFRYCPSCASTRVRFEENKKVYCPDCGLVYYHNTAAAAGLILNADGAVVLLVRGKDPAKGRLDLPGGFVDPAEGALEGLRRECREELGFDPAAAFPSSRFVFLASFPNTYPYRGFLYNTCDLFFTFDAPGLAETDITPERGEIAGVRFVRPGGIDYDEIAFPSARAALRRYTALLRGEQPFTP